MNVDTMRKIDRWAGVPLCFLLTPFVWLLDLMRSSSKTANVSRTLFIELSEMGSAIIVDPAMRKLRSDGTADLYFAIFTKNYKSLELLNTIPADHIFKMNADSIWVLPAEIIRFIFWCRKKKITTVIDLELFSRFTALLSFFSGAASRVGFVNLHDEGLYRGNIVNKGVRYNPHVHVSINFISLINRALGRFDNAYATIPVHPHEIKLEQATVSEEAKAIVAQKIHQLYPNRNGEKVVLLNVNASDLLPQRRWLQENFAEVGRNLLRDFKDIIIVLTGAPAEKAYVEQVNQMIAHERCVNSSGVFTFNELVPLYSLSTLMLTNDSGPAHFASVTPLKVFVLFGPETPHLYLPLGGNAEPFYLGLPCSPCVSAANHRKTSCETRPCITGIQPAVVYGRLKVFLETTN
ncbi:MAG TPA: glycosyltransferase family 9 protein [Lacibacter sp.]|nr:glycosyltransferase family 9 protein [Lacibacter sp.]